MSGSQPSPPAASFSSAEYICVSINDKTIIHNRYLLFFVVFVEYIRLVIRGRFQEVQV